MSSILIKSVTRKKTWEEFLSRQPNPPYIQNWNAGQMYENLGNSIFRLGIFKNDILVGVCFVIKEVSKRGSFLFIPYGPVLSSWSEPILRDLFSALRELGKREHCAHIKCAPFIQNSSKNKALYKKIGFINSPLHVLSELTLILDIRPSLEDILAQMRKNTRNLIRRAQKDGVQITLSTDASAMERFLKLHEKTVAFHNFIPYRDVFFKEHLRSFIDDDQVRIIEAWYKGQLLASAVVMFYGTMASYRHGASVHSKVPAAYLVQWAAITEARRRNMSTYNFWGIYDGNDKTHPFYGISLFKKGFGGEKLELLHCRDLPLSWRYWLFFWPLDMFRRYKRGFFRDSY